MSGGRWNYQSYRLMEAVEEGGWHWRLGKFIEAIAASEHIVDWSESGDTARRRKDGSGAERDLYDLWVKTFNEVYE